VDFRKLNLYSNFFSQCYDRSRHLTPGYLKWLYEENPSGQVIGFDAFFSEDLAAHYVCIPVNFYFNGNETKGLLSLNTATHPDHQRKGLFVEIAQKTYQHAKKNGFEFIIGVANSQSSYGFVKKLGFQLVKPLDVKIGIGLPKKSAIDKSYYQMHRVWTRELLTWRCNNPSKTYQFNKISKDRIVIHTNTGIAGIKAILYDSESYGLNDKSKTNKLNFNPLRIWIGIDPLRKWNHTFYFNLPDTLRFSPLNLIFKDLTGQNRLLSSEKINFTGFDFDAY